MSDTIQPATDVLGTDQQTALVILRRIRKRLTSDLNRAEQSIQCIEAMCVHDFQQPLRCGAKTLKTCTRCGAEELE